MALIPLEDYIAQHRAVLDQQFPSPWPTLTAPTQQPGFLSAPFERGLKGAQADLTAAAGLLAQSLGFDEVSQGLYDKAKEYAEARDAIPRRVPRMEDIQDMGDVGVFAIETLVENAPLLASILIPGGIAAKAASIAGAGARATQAAGVVASFLTDVGLQTGESVQIAQAAGSDPMDLRVIGSGVGKGLLDFVPLLTIAKRMGLLKAIPLGPVIEREISKQLVNGGFISRVAGEIGTIAAREIPTEVAQEVVNIALDRSLTQFHGALTEDEISQLKNAAAGAAAFSLLGIPAAISSPRDPDEEYEDPNVELDQLEKGAMLALPAPEDLPRLPPPAGGYPQLPPPPGSRRSFRISPDGTITPVIDMEQTAPGVWTVAPGGTIVPQGIVPEGNPDLRTAIKRELTPQPQNESAVLFNDDGSVEDDFSPDVLEAVANTVVTLPAEMRSQIDNSIIVMNGVFQEGKQRQRKLPATPFMQDPSQGLSADLRPLYDARNEILADPTSRNKKGDLTAAAKKRLDVVDLRIQRVAEMLGLATNLENRPIEDSKNIEQDLAKLNAAAQINVPTLNPGELKYLELLEQKEVNEGLTDEEDRALQALYLKRIQRPKKAKARRLNAHEIRALESATPFVVQEGPEGDQFLSSGLPEGVRMQRRNRDLFWRRLPRPPRDVGEIYQWYGFTAQPEPDQTYGVIRVAPLRDGSGNWEVITSDGNNLGTFFEIGEARRTLEAYVDKRTKVVQFPERMWKEDVFSATMPGELMTWLGTDDPATSIGGVAMTEDGRYQATLRDDNAPEGYKDIGVFETLEAAKSAVQDAGGMSHVGKVFHSKQKNADSKARFSVEQVASAVKELSANFPDKPTWIITPNSAVFRDVPSRKHLVGQKYNALGMYFRSEPDSIYIFSDRVKNTQQLAKTMLHEMFHRGFYRNLSPRQRVEFLKLIQARFPDELQQRLDSNHPEIVAALRVSTQARDVIKAYQNAALIEAEEIIADYAETVGPKDSFLDRMIAFFRQVIRNFMPNLKISDAEIRTLIRNVGAWRRKGPAVTARNYREFSEPFLKRDFAKLVGRDKSYTTETLPGIREWGEVWGQKFLNGVLTPLQMANSAYVKKTLPSASLYLEFVQKWWARKRNLTNDAVSIAEDWSAMGKRDAERLARAIFDISIESDRQGQRLSEGDIVKIFKANGLDPTQMPRNTGIRTGSRNLFQLWRDMDSSFQQVLNDMEKGLQVSVIRQAIREKGIPDPIRDRAEAEKLAGLWRSEADHAKFFEAVIASPGMKNLNLGARLLEIEAQIQQLRQRNYFPRMRFGKYAITVRAKHDMAFEGDDVKGPAGDKRGAVVWFETHESPGAQLDGRERLLAGPFGKSADFEVQLTRLSDNEFVFLGMPPALYEVLRGELGLTAEQEERLKEVYRKFSPGSAFLKHLIRRKDIAGFSTDALRIYASYMMNASNHLARVEFHQDLGDSLNNIRRESNLPENATRAGEIREYFARHYHYLMNPGNDWARLRSLGFLWYLGANVKSALVNLTQVPMVAYPFLAHHYGDKAAIGALAKATADVSKMMRGRKVFDVDTDRDLARGLADGFIDESRATELAGLAEGDILETLMPQGASSKIINKASYLGAFLFRHAEKFNRQVVFLAARELALQRGLKGEQVYLAAREAVQTTMFEYAKWNRPEYTRGKKSVFFLFTNYLQHLSYLAYGGRGPKVAMRLWLGLMMAAGVQGLPFAENFFDIFDWGSTEVKELLGSKDPRTAVREDIRELANTITDQPDLIMHGLGRYYGLGPMHFLALFDVPVPNVDISSSLSAGEIIPGLREAFATNEDPDAKLGKVMVDAFGPVVGIGYNLWRASVDTNPDTWKVWERAMPSAFSAVSKAFRRSQAGAETFRGGGKLVEFEPQNVEHRMENIAQAFGFAPTRLNQRQELRYSQEQLKQYWTSRRAALMEGYAYALLARDPEAVDLAKKKIREFNQAVPSRVLAIQADSLRSSITERYRRATLREYGIPPENIFRPLYRRIEQQYPEGSAAIPGNSPYPAPE